MKRTYQLAATILSGLLLCFHPGASAQSVSVGRVMDQALLKALPDNGSGLGIEYFQGKFQVEEKITAAWQLSNILEGSPFHGKPIKSGDIIYAFDGYTFSSDDDMRKYVRSFLPSQSFRIFYHSAADRKTYAATYTMPRVLPAPSAPAAALVRNADGKFLAAARYEWVDPNDPGNLGVKLRGVSPSANTAAVSQSSSVTTAPSPGVGLVRHADGNAHPASGYEWVNPDDPDSLAVKLKEGLIRKADGKFGLASGYEWVDPNDPDNLNVKPRRPSPSPATPSASQPSRFAQPTARIGFSPSTVPYGGPRSEHYRDTQRCFGTANYLLARFKVLSPNSSEAQEWAMMHEELIRRMQAVGAADGLSGSQMADDLKRQLPSHPDVGTSVEEILGGWRYCTLRGYRFPSTAGAFPPAK